MRLMQVMYGVCTVGDFTLIYKELKSIHLRTLNRVRAEMLFSHHLAHGTVRPRYSCSHLRTQSCIYWPWGVLARATLESIGS